jgi:biotin carboxyl carrier protein
MTFSYQHGGETYTVTLERLPDGRFRAAVGERSYIVDARVLKDGAWLLALDGERTTAYLAAQGNTRYVYANGQTHTLSLPELRANRRRGAGAGSGDLMAQMPGQVMDVLVSEGDTVERGQTLVIMEAMKMELRVTAPGNGRVKRLLVKTGDVVERGQALVEIGE